MKKIITAVVIAIAMAIILVSCAPTQRYVFKQCPTTMASLGDFTFTAAALAIAALKYNAGKTADSMGYAGFGMGLALSSNMSECRPNAPVRVRVRRGGAR